MQRKVIISCAVTGSADSSGKNPAVPVSPAQIAASCIDAAKAGAAVVHIHVRDPKTTKPSMDGAHYREVVERIRASGTDVLINLTTGPGARFNHDPNDPTKAGPDSTLRGPQERVRHVLNAPDICSLDMGSLNAQARVFINTDHLQTMASRSAREPACSGVGGVRDRPPAAGQEIHRGRPCEGPGYSNLPRHFLGQPATPGDHDLCATCCRQLSFVFRIRCQFPMVRRRCCSASHVRSARGQPLSGKGKLAPSTALVEKRPHHPEVPRRPGATPATRRNILGIAGTRGILSFVTYS